MSKKSKKDPMSVEQFVIEGIVNDAARKIHEEVLSKSMAKAKENAREAQAKVEDAQLKANRAIDDLCIAAGTLSNIKRCCEMRLPHDDIKKAADLNLKAMGIYEPPPPWAIDYPTGRYRFPNVREVHQFSRIKWFISQDALRPDLGPSIVVKAWHSGVDEPVAMISISMRDLFTELADHYDQLEELDGDPE